MIKRIDNLLITILNEMKNILLPIILIILVITIIKIIMDYKKYGNKILRPFRKSKNINISKESLEISIKNLKSYYKLIRLDDNILVLILECGIYIIYLLDYDGLISGDINALKLTFNQNKTNELEIINPIYKIKEQISELNKKVNENISGYILLKKGCIFAIRNKTNIKVIPANAFYYHFSKLINDKKYSIDKINKLYDKIVI